MGAIFRLFATDLGATQHHCFTMPEQLLKMYTQHKHKLHFSLKKKMRYSACVEYRIYAE